MDGSAACLKPARECALKLLVTGGAGFIGSRLVQRLVQDGHDVTVTVRATTNRSRLASVASQVTFEECDLRQAADVQRIAAKVRPEAIFHLATFYKVNHNPEDAGPMVETNVTGTIHLLEAARAIGLKLFINTSTCFVYLLPRVL